MSTFINPGVRYFQYPFLYAYGMNISVPGATTTAVITAGQIRDDSNQVDITVSTSTTLDGSVNGLNGLDVGSLANATWYAVFAMRSPSDFLSGSPDGYIMSTSFTNPKMPFGYTVKRLIGYVLTDGSAKLSAGYNVGNGTMRKWYWNTPPSVITVITGSFVAKDLSAGMPQIAGEIVLGGLWTPNSAGDVLYARPTGSASTNGISVCSGDVAALAHVIQPVVLPVALASSLPEIDVKATSASDVIAATAVGYGYAI